MLLRPTRPALFPYTTLFRSAPLTGTGSGPLVNISGDRLVPVGNYDSPILKPWAAAVVKKHGDILLSRSEERRVGKECRSRSRAEHWREKSLTRETPHRSSLA